MAVAGRVGGAEEFEELDKLDAVVAALDQGTDVPGEQIDTCHQVTVPWRLCSCYAHHGGTSREVAPSCRSPGFRLPVIGDDRDAPVSDALASVLPPWLAHAGIASCR